MHPAPEKGLANHMRLDSLCTYTVKDLEFLDTPIHRHVHMHDHHAKIQDYNDGTHCKCTTNYSLNYHANFARNVAHGS